MRHSGRRRFDTLVSALGWQDQKSRPRRHGDVNVKGLLYGVAAASPVMQMLVRPRLRRNPKQVPQYSKVWLDTIVQSPLSASVRSVVHHEQEERQCAPRPTQCGATLLNAMRSFAPAKNHRSPPT